MWRLIKNFPKNNNLRDQSAGLLRFSAHLHASFWGRQRSNLGDYSGRSAIAAIFFDRIVTFLPYSLKMIFMTASRVAVIARPT
jgi:hypothetical protein